MWPYVVLALVGLWLLALAFSHAKTPACDPVFPEVERRCFAIRKAYPYD